jgi:hypothetical protein
MDVMQGPASTGRCGKELNLQPRLPTGLRLIVSIFTYRAVLAFALLVSSGMP